MTFPSVWRCESCQHQGPKDEFKDSCPKCKSEDVFPTRWFKCDQCGHTAEQDDFFGNEIPKDDHPITDKWGDPVCPNEKCPSLADEHWEGKDEPPTTVTEIPVPGFAA